MANKLREMFNENNLEYNEKFSFTSLEKHNVFLDAVRRAIEDGEISIVDGIKDIDLSVKEGKCKYNIWKKGVESTVIVSPKQTPIKITVTTDKGESILYFNRKELKDKYVLENVKRKGMAFQVIYSFKNDDACEIKCRAEYNSTSTIIKK